MSPSTSGSHRQRTSLDLQAEVENVRMSVGNLHSKHKSLAFELQKHKDSEAKSKAELKHLRGTFCLFHGDIDVFYFFVGNVPRSF